MEENYGMKEIKVTELEVGILTEYGVVAEVVHSSDVEVVVNMVQDFFDNNYDATDDGTFEQFEFDADDTVLIS